MAYIENKVCIYCGTNYTNIHSSMTKYSVKGPYMVRTVNGKSAYSTESLLSGYWCGKCDKQHITNINEKLVNIIRKELKKIIGK